MPGSPRNAGILPTVEHFAKPNNYFANSPMDLSPSIHVNGIGIDNRGGGGGGGANGFSATINGDGAPLTAMSTSSSTSTNQSSSAFSHTTASSNSAVSRSPRFNSRNPILGTGCVDMDTYRRPRKVERGICRLCGTLRFSDDKGLFGRKSAFDPLGGDFSKNYVHHCLIDYWHYWLLELN